MELSLTPTELACLRSIAYKVARVDLARRGSSEHESLLFQFSHLMEEAGEAFSAWRRNDHEPRLVTDRFGLAKPEGLGSELGDMVAVALVICWLCDATTGLSPFEELDRKHEYAISNAMARSTERCRPLHPSMFGIEED